MAPESVEARGVAARGVAAWRFVALASAPKGVSDARQVQVRAGEGAARSESRRAVPVPAGAAAARSARSAPPKGAAVGDPGYYIRL